MSNESISPETQNTTQDSAQGSAQIENDPKKLFVGNLPFDVNDADLVTVFAVVGKVNSAKVVLNKKTGRSKGYGFVEMGSEELAKEAVQKFEGATLNERALTVTFASAKPKAPQAAAGTETNSKAAEASTPAQSS